MLSDLGYAYYHACKTSSSNYIFQQRNGTSVARAMLSLETLSLMRSPKVIHAGLLSCISRLSASNRRSFCSLRSRAFSCQASRLAPPPSAAAAAIAYPGTVFYRVPLRGSNVTIEVLDIPASVPSKPPLVLLHEGLGCIAFWRKWPQALAQATGSRVIAWSRAGYGASDPYPDARTARYLHEEGEAALPAVLKALSIEKPVLIGHSDGGSIALVFAGAYPDALRGAVVMAPHHCVEDITLSGLKQARALWETSDWADKLARYHLRPQAVWHDWNDTWLRPDFASWSIGEYLPRVRVPILAIQGYDDEFATMHQIDEIAARAPARDQVQLLKLERCGHSPHRDQEEAVQRAILSFLARLEGGQP